jgi:hypothetical protein
MKGWDICAVFKSRRDVERKVGENPGLLRHPHAGAWFYGYREAEEDPLRRSREVMTDEAGRLDVDQSE